METCDVINIFKHWCKVGSPAVTAVMSNDNTMLIPWFFNGLGHTGTMFKCDGSEFPLSVLKRKSDGQTWHALPITDKFIARFRSIINDIQNADTPFEILVLRNIFDGTRFETKFYARIAALQALGPVAFYQKMAILGATHENIFIQTSTTSADLVTEFAVQTGKQRVGLTNLVRFPEKIRICINSISEKMAAVMSTAEITSITREDAAVLLFFSDVHLEEFAFPSNIKYS